MSIWAAALLLLTPVAATDADEVLAPDQCPDVFGSEEAHHAHAARREARLGFVLEGGPLIVIAHSTDWETPEPIRLHGLELLETHEDIALVHLDAEEVGVDCPSGVYEIGADDGLGEDAQVVTVLDGLMLIERGEVLRYLLADGAGEPAGWRMVWSSPFSVTPYLEKGSGSKLRRTRRAPRRKRRR